MKDTLRKFTTETLFDATSALLTKLNIKFNRTTAEPIQLSDYYDNELPKYVKEALGNIAETYFIGVINEDSLHGKKTGESLYDKRAEVQSAMDAECKYEGMFVFACEAKKDANLTRTAAATLTRAFNRVAIANPVILVIRQGDMLSLSTCERMEYTQEWRRGTGEKLGKVSILRNVNCADAHRGHCDILAGLDCSDCTSFDKLYEKWMEVFSNELLTKKFYGELSDWFAWAVQVVRFPNDLFTTEDDTKYNQESCIRLITRLIFVWFLKQKHLVPKEFFDEDYIRENLIENFDPHDCKSLIYNSEESNYYRAILQNLFFATLNRPIVAEGKNETDNRRFISPNRYQGKCTDFNINNLMRYENVFKQGGAEKFLKLANQYVPFLNGGLFDCLDDKNKNRYYDGFSERKESLNSLYLPDYLFFGDEVGNGIDLSQWYDDKKKKCVSARGIIDILKRYSFTIEENTPYDQEVSLDPELLGKAFENLLAAYNPETKTSARKQTGSFYTPREIVKYMVDESLVAHLKRVCGNDNEKLYRSLLCYSDTVTELSPCDKEKIMKAIYNCKVLDPACGSGAFPMGMLQQMVHVLKRLDPTNEMWKQLMIDRAIEQSKVAFSVDSEAERRTRLDDIENAFNQSINYPDYARKLFLIENCIYGVDIQPIATQISKLRFFISLVVDQKPTDDARNNFGIRPLPNLESKFVAANTLIPVQYDSSLVDTADEVIKHKNHLKELNHNIFLAKRNTDKQRLKSEIKDTRMQLAKAIADTGFVTDGDASKLAAWDMFDQNTSSDFFDPEWMFGVKGGFDVVIGNPPYKILTKNNTDNKLLEFYINKYSAIKKSNSKNLYTLFIELAVSNLLVKNGINSFIVPEGLFRTRSYKDCVDKMNEYGMTISIVLFSDYVFENAVTGSLIYMFAKSPVFSETICYKFDKMYKLSLFNDEKNDLCSKIAMNTVVLNSVAELFKGMVVKDRDLVVSETIKNQNDIFLLGKSIQKWCIVKPFYTEYDNLTIIGGTKKKAKHDICPRIIIRRTGDTLCCALLENKALTESTLYSCWSVNDKIDTKFIYALLNSKVLDYYNKKLNITNQQGFPQILMTDLENLPIKIPEKKQQSEIIKILNKIIVHKNNDVFADVSSLESQIDHIVYHLYDLSYDEVLVIDPSTSITREEYNSFKI